MEDEALYIVSRDVEAYVHSTIYSFPDEFSHLVDANIGHVMTNGELKLRGRDCAAITAIPTAQGQNRGIYEWALSTLFGYTPDFLIIVQSECWQEFDGFQKVALIYHELSHIIQKNGSRGPCFSKEDGRPILMMVDHNLGEFFDVAAKFGEWEPGIAIFNKLVNDKSERIDQALIDRIVAGAKLYLKVGKQ